MHLFCFVQADMEPSVLFQAMLAKFWWVISYAHARSSTWKWGYDTDRIPDTGSYVGNLI